MAGTGSYTAWKATQRRALRRSLVRDVVVILVASVAVIIGGAFRTIPNERHPPAQALTERMDQVYRDQRAGAVDFPDVAAEVAPGIEGARIPAQAGRDERWAVTATLDDTCYAMWWDQTGLRRVRTVPTLVACTPANGAEDRAFAIGNSAPAAFEGEDGANWGPLLPDQFRIHIWWWPLVFLAGGLMMAAFVRIVVMLVTGKSVRGMT